MVEILCGEDWEHSEDISTVPREHWRWFLGAHVGNWRVKKIAGTAKPLIANLRILHGNEGWKELGLSTWSEALEFFGLDETKWQWLQAGEPVLLDSDSVKQAEQKGRSEMARQMKAENPELGPTEIGRMVGLKKQSVADALAVSGRSSDSDSRPDILDHLKGHTDRADFLKLSPDGQERVRQGEPLNRVALSEGVRKRLTPLEQAQKAFRGLTKEDQDAFSSWLDEQSQ